MIRTKTHIFIQRLNLEMQSLREYAALLERWNEDEALIDDMLDEYKNLVSRMQAIIREMNSLCTDEWSAIYQEQQELAKLEVLTEDFPPAGNNSDMPEDFAVTGCKKAE